ncbi:MAG: hypothetical protein OES38_11120 [Gammaproteobacteria bacterium]|nr:hypothetical protein [Gammaproteobacteria bacterium]
MASFTIAMVYQVKEGKGRDAAVEELQKIRTNAETLGGTSYLNWITAGGTAPPGSLVLFINFPDAETYAKAIDSDEATEFQTGQALGESALNVISTVVLREAVTS